MVVVWSCCCEVIYMDVFYLVSNYEEVDIKLLFYVVDVMILGVISIEIMLFDIDVFVLLFRRFL